MNPQEGRVAAHEFEKLLEDHLSELTRQFGEDAAQEAACNVLARLEAGVVINDPLHYLRRAASNARRLSFRWRKNISTVSAEGYLNEGTGQPTLPALALKHRPTQDIRAEARQLIERADPRLVKYGVTQERSGLSKEGIRALRRRQVAKLLVISFFYVVVGYDFELQVERGPFPTWETCMEDPDRHEFSDSQCYQYREVPTYE